MEQPWSAVWESLAPSTRRAMRYLYLVLRRGETIHGPQTRAEARQRVYAGLERIAVKRAERSLT